MPGIVKRLLNFQHAVIFIVRTIALSLIVVLVTCAQDSPPPQAPKEQASASTQNPPPSPALVQVDGSAVLYHLNQLINWYRHATTGLQSVGLPSDTIYQDNAKSLGTQVVQLGFQSAKAEAALLTAQQKANGGGQASAQTTQQQNLAQLQARTSTEIDQLQSQIESVTSQIAKTPERRRGALISQRDALQGQLELQKALLDAVQKMSAFVETNGETSGGLEGGINPLARSIPDVLGTTVTPQKAPAAAKPSLASAGGLISDAITLYSYVSAVHEIDGVIKETNYAREVADRLRTPLRDAMRATIQQSRTLGAQPPTSDPEQLKTERQEFQKLTDRFKLISAALLPLSQEMIVLNDSKANLEEWRNSISLESKHVLRSVLARVIAILVALGVLLFLSQIWRRITFKYVKDPRRRRQFLIMRRVVIGFLIVVVLVLGFVSEFSSLATFAGFITAGIAVGLQAVLLSVAAYFFIIGRYGIRVGDRISVAGITGDVVDIGLVRLYLMELAGTGLDFYPTGRIVVFSNAVLFQTGSPLFKQIPGTEYAWHEVNVKIAPDGNHKMVQEKLVAAVNSVYSKYEEQIERQHASIERHVDIQVDIPKPEARLQFSDTGLELLVRYPVEIRNAPDTDAPM